MDAPGKAVIRDETGDSLSANTATTLTTPTTTVTTRPSKPEDGRDDPNRDMEKSLPSEDTTHETVDTISEKVLDEDEEDERQWIEDPRHPRNWPARRKWTPVFIVSIFNIAVCFSTLT